MISTKSQVLPEDQTSHATTSDQLMAIDPILGSKGGHGGPSCKCWLPANVGYC